MCSLMFIVDASLSESFWTTESKSVFFSYEFKCWPMWICLSAPGVLMLIICPLYLCGDITSINLLEGVPFNFLKYKFKFSFFDGEKISFKFWIGSIEFWIWSELSPGTNNSSSFSYIIIPTLLCGDNTYVSIFCSNQSSILGVSFFFIAYDFIFLLDVAI